MVIWVSPSPRRRWEAQVVKEVLQTPSDPRAPRVLSGGGGMPVETLGSLAFDSKPSSEFESLFQPILLASSCLSEGLARRDRNERSLRCLLFPSKAKCLLLTKCLSDTEAQHAQGRPAQAPRSWGRWLSPLPPPPACYLWRWENIIKTGPICS